MIFLAKSIRIWKAILLIWVLYCLDKFFLDNNRREVGFEVVTRDVKDVGPPEDSLESKMFSDFSDCATQPQTYLASQRGDYWVLENYIRAEKTFKCNESITYTTQGDFRFLDNLKILTERWQGPLSVSMYATGSDFEKTVNEILYQRECVSKNIKELVTFHLFYHSKHVPLQIFSRRKLLLKTPDCSQPHIVPTATYKEAHNLLYPINLARNVARRASTTYFVFPSDIELYPSTNFIPEFLKMIKRPDFSPSTNPRVYVFSAFEVRETLPPPETKAQLVELLKTGDAIPFHMKVCPKCHNIPFGEEWAKLAISSNVSVAFSTKREGDQKSWEPFFLSTNKEPLFDERITWEAKNDKRINSYVLCLKEYDFHIMDNAFIVHRPGIKVYQVDPPREVLFQKQRRYILDEIVPEYKKLFGNRDTCFL